MHSIIILTDIPSWVGNLVRSLEKTGARVTVITDTQPSPAKSLLVNRVSASSAYRDPAYAKRIERFLSEEESRGLTVVNGARCHRLGYDKWAQADLFASCGVKTPATRLIDSSSRAFPHRPVLLKPIAGSYGCGIEALAPNQPIPPHILRSPLRFVEQERITPVDGCVHRVEILDNEILYDAATVMSSDNFDYCLSAGGSTTAFANQLTTATRDQVLKLARNGRMQIGSLEYLLDDTNQPWFIDFNPVSSFHPDVEDRLGFDPNDRVAHWLFQFNKNEIINPAHQSPVLPTVKPA